MGVGKNHSLLLQPLFFLERVGNFILFVYSLFNLKKASLSIFKCASISCKSHTVLVWSHVSLQIALSLLHFWLRSSRNYLSRCWGFVSLFNSAELSEVPPETRHQDKLWAGEVSLLAVPNTLSLQWFQEAKANRVWWRLGWIHLNGEKGSWKKILWQCPTCRVLVYPCFSFQIFRASLPSEGQEELLLCIFSLKCWC